MNQQFKTVSASTALTPDALAKKLAEDARFIRCHAVASIFHAGSGHPGGALSSADLFACLYGAEMNVWPNAVNDPARDRFVLSKGHAAPALYATGARYGFCDAKAALTLRKLNSPFQGHPHVLDLPWVETSTGSLGQGISVAVGMAIGLRLQKIPARVYTMLGDGELQEGEVWEAAMARGAPQARQSLRRDRLQQAAKRQLQRCDHAAGAAGGRNGAPSAGRWPRSTATIFRRSWRHLRRAGATRERPSVIIAHTIKGKGVPYMENIPAWHGSVKLTRAQAEEALTALGASADEMKDLLDVL